MRPENNATDSAAVFSIICNVLFVTPLFELRHENVLSELELLHFMNALAHRPKAIDF